MKNKSDKLKGKNIKKANEDIKESVVEGVTGGLKGQEAPPPYSEHEGSPPPYSESKGAPPPYPLINGKFPPHVVYGRKPK